MADDLRAALESVKQVSPLACLVDLMSPRATTATTTSNPLPRGRPGTGHRRTPYHGPKRAESHWAGFGDALLWLCCCSAAFLCTQWSPSVWLLAGGPPPLLRGLRQAIAADKDIQVGHTVAAGRVLAGAPSAAELLSPV